MRCAEIVRAGTSRVWEALATRHGWENWFCNRVLMDFQPGGFIHFRWKDFGPDHYTGDNRADILEVERKKLLAFRWKSSQRHPATIVRLSLEPRGPITIVRVEETGWGNDADAAITSAAGWGAALGWLKFWVEHEIRFDGRRPR